jgi:hypothetical protein
MSEKTPGEIACDAFAAHLVATPTGGVIGGCGLSTSWSQYSDLGKAAWEAAAAVIRAGAVEECAKVADEWGNGKWKVQPKGRVRFSVYDMQASVNTSGRGIAEDIRDLKSAPNKGEAS